MSKVISISGTAEMNENMKIIAKSVGYSGGVSELVRELADQYMPLLNTDTHEALKAFAEKTKTTVPELIQNLVEKYMPLLENDGGVPVLLKIPAGLKDDKLQEWLTLKAMAIFASLNKQ